MISCLFTIMIFQMDLDEVVIHDTTLGVNIFVPIVTGKKHLEQDRFKTTGTCLMRLE